MKHVKNLVSHLRKFHANEEGFSSVALCFMVPLFAWAFLTCVMYFDAYRAEAASERAAITVTDMLTREAEEITPKYLEGMTGLLSFLATRDKDPQFRVTVYDWDDANAKYEVRWSKAVGLGPNYDFAAYGDDELNALAWKLPKLSDGDVSILVETYYNYKVRYKVGISDFDYETFTVMRPRYTPVLCWNPSNALDPAQKVC